MVDFVTTSLSSLNALKDKLKITYYTTFYRFRSCLDAKKERYHAILNIGNGSLNKSRQKEQQQQLEYESYWIRNEFILRASIQCAREDTFEKKGEKGGSQLVFTGPEFNQHDEFGHWW
jgi:hypothetical protein